MSDVFDLSKIDIKAFRTIMAHMQTGMNVRTVEFQPYPDRGLYALRSVTPENATVRVRFDQAIAPYVMLNHNWEIETIVFARDVIMLHPGSTVVDVGANMGLFSRQLLGWTNNIYRLFAYEPDPENFACLTHNLSCFPGCALQMVGLAERDGSSVLHIDVLNYGNSSLIPHVSENPTRFTAINIQLKDIVEESYKWMSSGLPIFYKSDTQGYDEYLISLLPDNVCEGIFGGVIEIENSTKPQFDMQRFLRFLNLFPNKLKLESGGARVPVTTDEIIAMTQHAGFKGANIGFSR